MKKLHGFEIELGDLWKYESKDLNNQKTGIFLIISLNNEREDSGVLGYNLRTNTKHNYHFLATKEQYVLVSRSTNKD